MSWLVGSRLPWQPIKKSGFIVSCVLSICTCTPNMVTMRYKVFELHLFPFSTNPRLCLVTIATIAKPNMVLKTRGHTLPLVRNMPWSTFKKVLKFDAKNFELRSCTPPPSLILFYRSVVIKCMVAILNTSLVLKHDNNIIKGGGVCWYPQNHFSVISLYFLMCF